MKLPRLTLLAALLSSAPVAGQPAAERASIVASLDPAILAGPAPLAAPLVFAHGNLGIPRVITWANTTGVSGIAWGSTAAIVAGNAYVTYNGTDMVLNVPTGDGFSFLVNNVEIGGLPTAGGFETNIIQILSGTTLTIQDAAGLAGPVFTDAGTTIDVALDGALTVTGATTLNAATIVDGSADGVQLTAQGNATQTVNIFVVENSATTDLFTVSAVGNVEIAGTLLTQNTALVNGSVDAVQLTVQGHTTQTTLPFVVENSAGTDQFTVSNAGAVVAVGAFSGTQYTSTIATGTSPLVVTSTTVVTNLNADTLDALSSAAFAQLAASNTFSVGGQLVDGSTDVVQLTVQGFSTQTTLPFVVENSAGVDQFTVSNAGDVVALGAGTWTGDITANGGVGALGFGAGETIVPADAVLNVTGGVTMSADLIVSGGDITSPAGAPLVIASVDSSTTIRGNGVVLTTEASALLAAFVAVRANITTLGGQIEGAHISGGGGLTTGAVAGTGCGTSSLATQSGNDIHGILGVTCGTAGTTTNPFVTITFADAYSTAPRCTFSPTNAATAAGQVLAQMTWSSTTTTFSINCGGGVCTSGALEWSYSCGQ